MQKDILMHLTNLVVFNGVPKTMLMNWKTVYIEEKEYFLMYYGNLAA